MKAVSQTYKDNIKQLGKEITYEITYGNTTLGDEDILNANLHYDGGMLKSVMKQLDIELYNDIPIGTELTYKFGVKVDDTNYEKINYGKFIVYSSEKLEDSNTYKLVCYDKMLYVMKDYEAFATFPITIRDYINALCNHLGLTFANTYDDFTNYDKTIENELYIDNEGNNIGYTYRDVLDELAQATASTICINDNDELEIRYITNANEEKTSISGTSLSMTAHDNNVDIDLLGNTTQETTTGKNLFISSTSSTTTSGMTFTKNSDGSWTLNGTNNSGSTYYLRLNDNFTLSAGTYTLSNSNPNVNNDTGAIFYDDNNNLYPRQNIVTKTFSSSVTIKPYIKWNAGVTLNNFKIYPMIESGSNYTGFEKYTGTQPSPSPNYPQPIETTTGRNVINVSGKNLLNVVDGTYSNNGLTATITNGQISVSGTSTATSFLSIIFNTLSLKAGTYTLSANNSSSYNDNDFYLRVTTKNGSNVLAPAKMNVVNAKVTFTLSEDLYEGCLQVRASSGDTLNNFVIIPQLEKGSSSSTYEPYKENSYEVNLGKNLFDEEELLQATGWQKGNDYYTGNTSNLRNYFINTAPMYNSYKENTRYTFSWKGYLGTATNVRIRITYTDSSTQESAYITTTSLTSSSITSQVNKTISSININYSNNGTLFIKDLQLEEGSTVTSYSLYFEPIELCKIGTYQDKIFKNTTGSEYYNSSLVENAWYKYNAIGKVVLNGSESWVSQSYGTNSWALNNVISVNYNANEIQVMSRKFKGIEQVNRNTNDSVIYTTSNNQVYIRNTPYTTLAQVQSGMSNEPLYYVLATPTYTKIENDELIGQLEHIRLLNGYNNVISSSPITLDYVSSIDTIDEEYLKDINVNFGEEVKPINTITFKRSGDTDVISLSYPEDLDDNLKNEIAISENQILNYDNRDEYLKGILDRLYGLSYCLNDYTSTGITYYDLCDRYEVSITKTDFEGNVIETNFYPCIMFNDEINVNQGLQEIVHTDRAEESITDYTTTTKTDRLKTRTDLIVDKQNGEILAVTGVLDIQEDGTSKVINGIQTTQNKDRLRIEAIVTKEGEGENEVYTGVRTGDEHKTFTFDTNGLTIESLNNAYKNIQNETGNYYYDGDTMIGKYTKDGSVQKDMALFGKYYYGVDENVNVETFNKDDAMFVSQLYEDGNGETGFGHFYNGD